MINDDILVKYSINRLKEGYQPTPAENNWVDYTRLLKKQILECKLGFPGIGDGDLTLARPWDIVPGMRIILDDNLDYNSGQIGDTAPLLVLVESIDSSNGVALVEIEGIGCGYDFIRDPDRNLKWRDKISIGLGDYQTILIMTAKPRNDGGSVYYYYNKHTRDSRY